MCTTVPNCLLQYDPAGIGCVDPCVSKSQAFVARRSSALYLFCLLQYLAVLPGTCPPGSAHARSTTFTSPLSTMLISQLCSVLHLTQGSKTTDKYAVWWALACARLTANMASPMHAGYIIGRGVRVVEWDVAEHPDKPDGDLASLKLRALTPDGIRMAIAKEYGLSNYREVMLPLTHQLMEPC